MATFLTDIDFNILRLRARHADQERARNRKRLETVAQCIEKCRRNMNSLQLQIQRNKEEIIETEKQWKLYEEKQQIQKQQNEQTQQLFESFEQKQASMEQQKRMRIQKQLRHRIKQNAEKERDLERYDNVMKQRDITFQSQIQTLDKLLAEQRENQETLKRMLQQRQIWESKRMNERKEIGEIAMSQKMDVTKLQQLDEKVVHLLDEINRTESHNKRLKENIDQNEEELVALRANQSSIDMQINENSANQPDENDDAEMKQNDQSNEREKDVEMTEDLNMNALQINDSTDSTATLAMSNFIDLVAMFPSDSDHEATSIAKQCIEHKEQQNHNKSTVHHKAAETEQAKSGKDEIDSNKQQTEDDDVLMDAFAEYVSFSDTNPSPQKPRVFHMALEDRSSSIPARLSLSHLNNPNNTDCGQESETSQMAQIEDRAQSLPVRSEIIMYRQLNSSVPPMSHQVVERNVFDFGFSERLKENLNFDI